MKLHTNVYNIFVNNSPELETTQMFFDREVDKLVGPYNSVKQQITVQNG